MIPVVRPALCPQCDQLFAVRVSALGLLNTTARCPNCERVYRLPPDPIHPGMYPEAIGNPVLVIREDLEPDTACKECGVMFVARPYAGYVRMRGFRYCELHRTNASRITRAQARKKEAAA